MPRRPAPSRHHHGASPQAICFPAARVGDADELRPFRLTIVLFNHGVFGYVALAVALLNLLRPSIVLISLALAAAAFGVVLHNADLSALAAGLLILSLARPAPAAE